MRATGIVRRIDDLGRVVIPKEIRREMKIREGDPLEIFVDKQNNLVCFQRYNVEENFIEDLKRISDSISEHYYYSDHKENVQIIKMAIEEIKNQFIAIKERGENEIWIFREKKKEKFH